MRKGVSCNHTVETTCSLARDPHYKCSAACEEPLACGHLCKNKCHQCIDSGTHGPCATYCSRKLFCGHSCTAICHPPTIPCSPCTSKCTVKCQHSSCSKDCAIPCDICAEPCAWTCPHQGQCPLPCGAPCTRLPCNLRCTLKLPCNHQCPSLCGERCPTQDYCPVCGKTQIKEKIVDLVSLSSLEQHFQDPDAEPVIILSCGHVYTVSSLDGYIEIVAYYESDKTGFIKAKPLFGESNSTDRALVTVKGCPECRAPISGIFRYGRAINTAIMNSAQR